MPPMFFSARLPRVPIAVVAGAFVLAGATRAAPPSPPSGPRELNTDRPDATESPFTLEAGRLQLELDVSSFTFNQLDRVRTTEWVVVPFNLRYGLTPEVEAGIFVQPQVRVTAQRRDGPKTAVQGGGDTTLRAKWNFRGNDGGATACGVIADLKLPTAAADIGNGMLEGSLLLPVAYELAGGWEGGAMTGVQVVATGRGRRAVWVNTITFAHDLAPEVGGFVELTSATGDGAHLATFNCGLTRRVHADLQLDCGLNFGVTRQAPDLGVYAGLSRRF